jgi:putative ABC transport system permease protein
MHAWLQDFACRVDMPIWAFLAAGMLAAFIALATISVRAIRAAVTNPVDSLRSE